MDTKPLKLPVADLVKGQAFLKSSVTKNSILFYALEMM